MRLLIRIGGAVALLLVVLAGFDGLAVHGFAPMAHLLNAYPNPGDPCAHYDLGMIGLLPVVLGGPGVALPSLRSRQTRATGTEVNETVMIRDP